MDEKWIVEASLFAKPNFQARIVSAKNAVFSKANQVGLEMESLKSAKVSREATGKS